eukprot:10367486-Lingulodinium_polyedra.AAC.1
MPRKVEGARQRNSFPSARDHGFSALLLLAVVVGAVPLSVVPVRRLASRATLTSPASLANVRSSTSSAVCSDTSSRSSW